jgi:magnesium-transporting ATPase (P-type)
VLVFRNSIVQQVRTNEVVEGDMVFINEGDIVPCDMMIAESKKLKLDITSLNIHKQFIKIDINAKPSKNLFESRNVVFFSTLVVNGSGTGICYRSGVNSII